MSIHRLIIIVVFVVSICSSCDLNEVSPNEMTANKNLLNELYKKSWELMYSHPDSALYYADLLIEMAGKINDKLGLVNGHYAKGNAYNELYYFDLAAKEFYETLPLLKGSDSKAFLLKKALTLQGLGQSYDKTYNYDMAIEMYGKGLEIAKAVNYEESVADMNYNLGLCYREKNRNEDARKYFLNAVEVYQKIGKYLDMADSYNMMGLLYHKEGRFYAAREYYEDALLTVKKHNISTSNVSSFINNIGEIHFVQGQYDEAEKYYADALTIAQEFNDIEKIKLFTNNLGDVYLKQGNYSDAITLYEKSIALGNGEERIDGEIKRAYKQLVEAYKKMDRYEDAWTYNDKFLFQTISLEETKYNLIGQNADYKIKEVEQERQLSEEIMTKTRHKLMSATFALGFSLLVLLYVLKSSKSN